MSEEQLIEINVIEPKSSVSVFENVHEVFIEDTVVNKSVVKVELEEEINNKTEIVYIETSPVNVEVAGTINIFGEVSKAVNGAVFITNITPLSPLDNVGEKVFDDLALKECTSTTGNVVIHVVALSGHSRVKPKITIMNQEVTLNTSGIFGIWEGNIEVFIPSHEKRVKAIHDDGPEWATEIKWETPPLITNAFFDGGYPGTQTELKEDDTFNFVVYADKQFVEVEIQDFGACKHKVFTTEPTTFFTGTAIIANRGNTPKYLNFIIRVKSVSGSWSIWFSSSSTVRLNNARPNITINSISYPFSQQAIKNNEIAYLNLTCDTFSTINFISSQLNINNPDQYQTVKELTIKSTDYNISNNNLSIVAHLSSNNSYTTVNTVVKIVNVAATLSISTTNARLRSGGSYGTTAQNHTVFINSNQPLIQAPVVDAPSGTLSGVYSGSGSNWQTTITISDGTAKGSFSWQNLSGVGLSGIPCTGTGSYVVGGFVKRTLTVGAWPIREASIGTTVTNTSKLRCTNLSKGAPGSLNFTYQGTTAEAVNKYTVLNGYTWYNCDGLNASSNTSGTMQIELEEIV